MSKRLKLFTVASTLALGAVASHASTLTCDFNSYKPVGLEEYKAGSTLECGGAADALVVRSLSTAFNFGLAAADYAPYVGMKSSSTYAVGVDFGFEISGAKSGKVLVDQFSFSIVEPGLNVGSSGVAYSYSINGGAQKTIQLSGAEKEPRWVSIPLVGFADPIETIDFFSTAGSAPNSVLIDNLMLSLRDVPAVVPEPASYGLTLAALLGAFVATSRRRRAR